MTGNMDGLGEAAVAIADLHRHLLRRPGAATVLAVKADDIDVFAGWVMWFLRG